MAREPLIRRCRNWYAKLLRLYPKTYRERFGEGMQQTFNDLLRGRVKAEKGLFGFALWMFFETSAAIIRENATTIMQNKNIMRIAIGPALILLIPLVLTLLGSWHWRPGAFVFFYVLLFGAGLTYELVAKRMSNKAYRFAVGLAVVTALVLTWMNLAVEIIGDNNPANVMYFGVLLLGVLGAVIARFEPRGMARALFATALVQALVPVIALIFWRSNFAPGVLPVFGLNGCFVLLFLVSAFLFLRASVNRNRS